jgi:hypothetical protein
MGSDFDELRKRLRGFDIQPTATGGYSVKTNGTSEDNDSALKALMIMTGANPQALPSAPTFQRPPGLLSAARPRPSQVPTLADTIRTYAETEAKTLKPNTWAQRKRACVRL